MAGEFSAYAPTLIGLLAQDFNLQPWQAAGIVGQLGHESDGLQAINERNPLVPGSRGGFGWAQWTGPRRRQFEQYAAQSGLDPTSPEANYGFLKKELQGPEGRVLDRIRESPDPFTAGRTFTDKFLRPGVPGYASRDKWTERALALAGQGAVGAFEAPPASPKSAPAGLFDALGATEPAEPEAKPKNALGGLLQMLGGSGQEEDQPVPIAPRLPQPQTASLADFLVQYFASQGYD
jgi:hypothetical protein